MRRELLACIANQRDEIACSGDDARAGVGRNLEATHLLLQTGASRAIAFRGDFPAEPVYEQL